MTITLTKEMKQMKAMIRNFVEKEVEPLAQQIEEEDLIPQQLVEMSKELGLFGISIPEQYGGSSG